jgi:hypothetical protein|tara:strand:- start:1176 stop:1673 length:498 start_codon:yes stop_codon:yes gene_type:complete
MWTVIKLDQKKINLLKEDLKKRAGNEFKLYLPKLKVEKFNKKKFFKKELNLLGDYALCFLPNFNDCTTINNLKYLRGLKYFLNGFTSCQKEIIDFINRCKKIENKDGYISSNLFETEINKYYKFTSGPFNENIFKIIEFQKNKINILMGSVKATISKKEFLYNPA